MSNIIALIVIITFGFWMREYLSRKKETLAEKELQQKNRFMQETKPFLSSPALSRNDTLSAEKRINQASDYFKSQGYKLSEHARGEGIDLVGIREKELIMVFCPRNEQDLNVGRIKTFIADTVLHLEKNPMLSQRKLVRFIVTADTLKGDDVSTFLRSHPHSLTHLSLKEQGE